MKCFYHSADLDGICSGAIIKYFCPDCEMFGIDHGQNFPWNKIKKDELVYMVDFSLQPFKNMKRLNNMCDLVWIDHHKSAIEDCENLKTVSIKGIRKIGLGACALAWQWFSPDRIMPYGVKLLAEYDVWDLSNPDTLPFQYGMKVLDTGIESPVWSILFGGDGGPDIITHKIVKDGKTVLKYINRDNRKYCRACAFETEIDGLRYIAINKLFVGSKAFESVWNPKKYHAMLSFGWRDGQWIVSLYSDRADIDVAEIAKRYALKYGHGGGGGHAGAAGCQVDSIDFILKN